MTAVEAGTWRRLRRVAAWTLASTAVLVAALLVAIHTPPARRALLRYVEQRLAEQQIGLQIEALSYNLLALSLDAQGIEVRSLEAPGREPIARIQHASLDLALPALLRGRYIVESATIQGVDVAYIVDEAGNDNVPKTSSPGTTSSEPLDYLIRHLELTDARLRYEDRARRTRADVAVTSILVDGRDDSGRHAVRAEIGPSSLEAADRQVPVDRVSANLDLGRDDVRIDRVLVEALQSNATLSGTVTHFDDPIGDLTLAARVDVPRMAALAMVQMAVAGTLHVNARAQGPVASPAVEARVVGRELAVRGLEPATLDLTAAYDPALNHARVAGLALNAPWGAVLGTASLSLDDGGESEVSATIRQLDADRLLLAAQVSPSIATRVDGRVNASWPGTSYRRVTGTLDAAFTPASAADGRRVPLGGHVSAKADAGRLDGLIERLAVPGVEVNGNVLVSEADALGGDLHVNTPDVGAAVATLNRLRAAPSPLLPVPVAGPLTVDAQLGGALRSPEVVVALDSPALTIGAVRDIALEARAAYSPAAVRLDAFDASWGDAYAHAAGEVGLTGAQPLRLTLSAAALDIPTLIDLAGRGSLPVNGTLALDGVAAGTLRRPSASLDLNATGLSAYDEQLGTLTASARLDGREVSLSHLLLEKPQGDTTGQLDATGRFHLDQRTYAFDIRSRNLELTTLTLPGERTLTGRFDIDGRGEGSVADPSGSLVVEAEDLHLNGESLGTLALEAAVDEGEARVAADAERYQTHALARASLQQPYTATLDARVDDFDLTRLPISPETLFSGRTSVTLHAAGDLERPREATVEASIDTLDAEWNGQPVGLSSPALLRYADERLSIDRFDLAASDSTLSLSGTLPLTANAGEGALQIESHLSLATLAAYAPADTSLSAEGEASLTGSIRGTLASLDPNLQLSIDNASISTPALEPGLADISARAAVSDGTAVLDHLSARWGAATLSFTGRAPLSAIPDLPVRFPPSQSPAEATARVTGIDPAAVPGAPEGLAGLISVDARLSSPSPSDFSALSGRITFPDLQLGYRELSIAQEQPISIGIQDGRVAIERFALSGNAGTLSATGTIDLAGERMMNLGLGGEVQLAAVSAVTSVVRAEGVTRLDLRATGPLDSPDVNGTVAVADAAFVSDNPRIAAEEIAAELTLDGRRVTLERLDGELNGGRVRGSGVIALGGPGGIEDVNLQLATTDFAYDAPLNLRSLSDATIRVTRQEDDVLVGGEVIIKDAGLTGNVNFDTGLLATIGAPRRLDLTEERNPLLERTRFDVHVKTASPVLIDNNLAQAEAAVDVRVLGTPYETGLAGQLELLEGGIITLNERRYIVERGLVRFVDERRIEPSFDLRLNTTASHYDIAIAVTGAPGETETTLTSSPSLPEPDIMAMLVTGRTLDDMRGAEGDVAREQVLSYLTGRVGSTLGRGLERATGLSEVRIEPNLIANETDPSARLTVGQDITEDLELVYSTNLADSNDQIWVAQYDVTRRFQTRAVRQSDDTYRLDFRHDVQFGGLPEPRQQRRPRLTVRSLQIPSDVPPGPDTLRDLLGTDEGKRYDFFEARRGVERIERYYRDHGHRQARVRLERTQDGKIVDLRLTVTPGPLVELVFEGAQPPHDVQEEVAEQWRRGVFDAQRIDDSRKVLREWLLGERHVSPTISVTVDDIDADHRRATFDVDPGIGSEKIVLAFEGASGVPPKDLQQIVESQNLEHDLFLDPVVVTELLGRYYREQGFLAAHIDDPVYEVDASVARVVLHVDEGPRFSTSDVRFSGNREYDTTALLRQIPLKAGDTFLPAVAERSLERLRDLYWSRGYNDMRSSYSLVVDRERGEVQTTIDIVEGRQSIVAAVSVEGSRRTSEDLVRDEVKLDPAKPLDLAQIGRARKSLYATGAFSVVDITREDAPAASSPIDTGDGGATSQEPDQKPVNVKVSVREVQPFQLGYGLSFDTERGVGGILDLSNHNSLGNARVIGVRTRYDGQVRELRGYFNQPSLASWPIKTTAAIYYREERNPATDVADAFNFDRRGVSIQQERYIGSSYVWSYGYRFERVREFGPTLGRLDESGTVSPLTSTFTRETRDEVLDASSGSFISHAFSFSPSWLGSDVTYVRYLGQFFHYFPLQPVRRKPLTNEILRPRLVFATGVRLGLANGFGGDVPMSERFFAGGSTTLRGFEQNAVGPIGADRIPEGGEALFVLNNELRVPLVSLLDGVVFADIGNVFDSVRDFSFTDLRESAGVGLRLRTPWFLIRGDWGFALDRRPGERRSRFYFSIGQAF